MKVNIMILYGKSTSYFPSWIIQLSAALIFNKGVTINCMTHNCLFLNEHTRLKVYDAEVLELKFGRLAH